MTPCFVHNKQGVVIFWRNSIYFLTFAFLLKFFDILLTIAHLALIGFNLFGWMWIKTRKAHLVTVSLTAFCWFVLGIWFGWGYCPITDWQWKVKERLGEINLPGSFIKYYADKISGKNIDPSIVDTVTLVSFLLVIILTIYFNFFKRTRKS